MVVLSRGGVVVPVLLQLTVCSSSVATNEDDEDDDDDVLRDMLHGYFCPEVFLFGSSKPGSDFHLLHDASIECVGDVDIDR